MVDPIYKLSRILSDCFKYAIWTTDIFEPRPDIARTLMHEPRKFEFSTDANDARTALERTLATDPHLKTERSEALLPSER
jgi:hypothetical protein